ASTARRSSAAVMASRTSPSVGMPTGGVPDQRKPSAVETRVATGAEPMKEYRAQEPAPADSKRKLPGPPSVSLRERLSGVSESASTWVWTGTSRGSAPSERNCSRLGRIGSSAGSVGTDGPSGEAGRCVRVAGGSGLVDQQQQSVGVAVEA